MAYRENVVSAVADNLSRNVHVGMLSFVLQRITGVALTLYLILHLVTLSGAFGGADAFNHSVGKFDNPAGHFLEYGLLLAVLFHMVNGLRIVIADFFALTRSQARMLWGGVVLCLLIAVFTVVIFIPELFQ